MLLFLLSPLGSAQIALLAFAAFAGVAASADAVHRDGEVLVGLGADAAKAHGAGGKAPHDLAGGLDVGERDPSLGRDQVPQPAQRDGSAGLLVDPIRVLAVALQVFVSDRALERRDDLGVPQVALALGAEVVLAAAVEGRAPAAASRERGLAAQPALFGDVVEIDAAEARGRPGEVALDHVGAEAEGLEDLPALVALERADAHLAHDLEQALVDGLDEVLARQRRVPHRAQDALPGHLRHAVEGHVGVHRAGAVAEQEREVVHLPGVAGLDQEPDAHARAVAHQVAVHRAQRQQARHRHHVRARAAVREHDHAVVVEHREGRLPAQLVQGRLEPAPALCHRVDDGQRRWPAEVDALGPAQRRQLLVGQDGTAELEHLRVIGQLEEQVVFAPDEVREAHHQRLADGIDGRIGDLGEVLLEVVEEQLGSLGQHRERGVGAHAADGLFAPLGHGSEHELQVFGGVPEHPLAL